MSYNKKSVPLALRRRHTVDSLKSGLMEWGLELYDKHLYDFHSSERELAEWEIDRIPEISNQDFESLLEGKSPGARYLARRLRREDASTIEDILSDWAALKDIRKWMKQQDPDWLISMSLAYKKREGGWVGYSWTEPTYRIIYQPGKLLHLGIRFAWQAERFCKTYDLLCNKKRPWGSCFQPDHGRVKALALTPNFNRLPNWVKRVLAKRSEWLETERIGDIWRLIDCCYAWRNAPRLPKAIAEKLGKSHAFTNEKIKLAGLVWDCLNGHWSLRNLRDVEGYDRTYRIEQFWEVYRWSLHEFSKIVINADPTSDNPVVVERYIKREEKLFKQLTVIILEWQSVRHHADFDTKLALAELRHHGSSCTAVSKWIEENFEEAGQGYYLSKNPTDYLLHTYPSVLKIATESVAQEIEETLAKNS
jgi:hypothetical protein